MFGCDRLLRWLLGRWLDETPVVRFTGEDRRGNVFSSERRKQIVRSRILASLHSRLTDRSRV